MPGGDHFLILMQSNPTSIQFTYNAEQNKKNKLVGLLFCARTVSE